MLSCRLGGLLVRKHLAFPVPYEGTHEHGASHLRLAPVGKPYQIVIYSLQSSILVRRSRAASAIARPTATCMTLLIFSLGSEDAT